MPEIIRTVVGFRGPRGALDMTTLELATGAPGTDITYVDGVLAIPRGDTGEPGPKGPSAFAVAVANGFGGSEAEWLASLKGEAIKGDPGQSWTITVVTTQAAYDAATPGPLELVVRI